MVFRPDRRTFVKAVAAAAVCASTRAEEIARPDLDGDIYKSACRAALAGKVVTVTGAIDPQKVGFALMHEHLFIDWFHGKPAHSDSETISPGILRQMQQSGWQVPRTPDEIELFNRNDIELDMIDRLRRGSRSRANYKIDDEGLMLQEVQAFKRHGGMTIVDQTVTGLGRDPHRLKRFAKHSGLNIVMGAGWYRWPFHEQSVLALSIESMMSRLSHALLVGDGGPGIKAGMIGEIPLDSRSIAISLPNDELEDEATVQRRSMAWRQRLLAMPVKERNAVPADDIFHPFEMRQLRAAARLCRLTGAPLAIHGVEPYIGYIDVLESEGVAMDRVVVSHGHHLLKERDLLTVALARGINIQSDYFLQHYATRSPLGELDVILDGIVWAVNNGHIDRITVSTDICNKLGLAEYGGGGYGTIFNHVIPELRRRGLTDEQVSRIIEDNPRRLLTWAPPRSPHHLRASD